MTQYKFINEAGSEWRDLPVFPCFSNNLHEKFPTDFLEVFLPRYSSDNDVLMEDDVTKLLGGEIGAEEMHELGYPYLPRSSWEAKLIELRVSLVYRATNNFFRSEERRVGKECED